jgi:hypothetical protein
MSRSRVLAASCAVVGCLLATNAQAGQILLDFNDLTTGTLNGQAGGTGVTGSWSGDPNPQVISGNLTAPTATHYTLAQSAGTAQSIRTTASSTNLNGQDVRAAANAPLAGTVWFSFLVNPNDTNARAGISFNASGPAAGGARMDAVGSGFFLSNAAGAGATTSPVTLALNTAHLVVGEVIVNQSNTDDYLRLWIDPDVQTLTESTTTGRIFDGLNGDWVSNGITSVAVQSYGSTGGGTVDAVRVSNTTTAQSDVTGFGTPTPEPGSLAFCALAAAPLLARRRRGR